MPYTGKPYRLGENWFISESVRHPSGCQTSKMVPLSIDQVRQLNGLPALATPPAYVERPLAQQIREGLAAGKSPADILPFGGQKPSEFSESYETRLARAERLEREINRVEKNKKTTHVEEIPLRERIAKAIAAGRRAEDVRPFDDKYR